MTENKPINILITDDHRLFRQCLRSSLQKIPGLVIIGEAENGQVAFQKARELQPDIILMDISMPVLDGIEATRQIKTTYPAIIIIAISNNTDEYSYREMMNAGATDYLQKSISLMEIVQSIRQAYAQRNEPSYLNIASL